MNFTDPSDLTSPMNPFNPMNPIHDVYFPKDSSPKPQQDRHNPEMNSLQVSPSSSSSSSSQPSPISSGESAESTPKSHPFTLNRKR